MTAAHLVNTCPSCGAEESLDALLCRLIDDDHARRLVADLLERSLPVGGLVLRYLRLHKPPKHKLRMERVAAVLAELVPDIKRGAITHKGREWQAPLAAWKAGFQAVFDAVEKGTLAPPLNANAYLYEVLMRLADRAEAGTEREAEAGRRTAARSHASTSTDEPAPVAAVLQAAPAQAPPPAPYTGPSRYALKLRAEAEARLAQRAAHIHTSTPAEGETKP